MKEMIFTKIKSAVFSSMILGCFYFLLNIQFGTGAIGYVLLAISFALFGNVIYGIPVSILSDFLTKKIGKYRFILAASLHLMFGLLSSVFLGELGVYAVVCSLVFFLSEEWQRMRKHGRGFKLSNKMALINTVVPLILFAFAFLISMEVSGPLLQKKTKEYFLIPQGYEGEIRVVYDVKDASIPKKSGDYDVYHINEKGYALSPLPERSGIIDNQYFYIDSEGNKEKIEENCISSGGMEGIQTSEYEYTSSDFTVTNSRCSEDYRIYGEAAPSQGLSLEEIIEEEGLNEQNN